MTPTVRYLSLFFVYSVIGFALQVTPFFNSRFVEPFIVVITSVSGSVISVFGGTAEVISDVLRSPLNGFAVQVDNGCSGLEAVILVCAATIAFPTSWRLRLLGAVASSTAILILNVIRIISLFYLGQYSMTWFEWAHLYAWDILIMIDGLLAVLIWIRFVQSKKPQSI